MGGGRWGPGCVAQLARAVTWLKEGSPPRGEVPTPAGPAHMGSQRVPRAAHPEQQRSCWAGQEPQEIGAPGDRSPSDAQGQAGARQWQEWGVHGVPHRTCTQAPEAQARPVPEGPPAAPPRAQRCLGVGATCSRGWGEGRRGPEVRGRPGGRSHLLPVQEALQVCGAEEPGGPPRQRGGWAGSCRTSPPAWGLGRRPAEAHVHVQTQRAHRVGKRLSATCLCVCQPTHKCLGVSAPLLVLPLPHPSSHTGRHRLPCMRHPRPWSRRPQACGGSGNASWPFQQGILGPGYLPQGPGRGAWAPEGTSSRRGARAGPGRCQPRLAPVCSGRREVLTSPGRLGGERGADVQRDTSAGAGAGGGGWHLCSITESVVGEQEPGQSSKSDAAGCEVPAPRQACRQPPQRGPERGRSRAGAAEWGRGPARAKGSVFAMAPRSSLFLPAALGSLRVQTRTAGWRQGWWQGSRTNKNE